MKLIDILVEETIENGWSWPSGCNSIAQDEYHGDREGDIYAYINALSGGNYWSEDNDSGYGKLLFKGYEVAEDASTSLVTRQQYEAALAAKNDGWIEWSGGKCPVEKGTLVDVKFRADDRSFTTKNVTAYRWDIRQTNSDIIAYRLHKPQEADLNECASQDASPVWNGEGLPPVGCECEVYYGSVELIDGVSRPNVGDVVRVVSHEKTEFGTQVVVVYWNGVNGGGRAHALIPKCLRPLRTEAERKREAAVGKIFDVICKSLTDESESTSFAIYDAIAAGEIPGVKLED